MAIKLYEREVTGSATPTSPALSLGAYDQVNNAESKLAATVTNITEKFQDAQRTNTLLDEQNKMAQHYFDLQGEVDKQDTPEQLNYYTEQSSMYREQMRERITDPKVLKPLEEMWLQHDMRGKMQTNTTMRQNIAQDGIASAADGDNQYLTQLYGLKDKPVLVDAALQDRLKAYDDLVTAGHMNASAAEKYKTHLRSQTAESMAAFAISDDPYKAVEALQDPNRFRDLQPLDREKYIARGNAEIRRDEAEQRAEQRARHAEAMAYVNGVLMPEAQRAMADAVSSGNSSPEYEGTMRELSKYAGMSPSITRVLDKMNRIGNISAVVTDAKTTSPIELGKQLEAANNDWDNIPLEKREELKAVAGIYKEQQGMLKNGTHLDYMTKYHVGGVTPLSVNATPADVQARTQQIEYAKQTFGGNPDRLTASEAGSFAQAWSEGDERTRLKLGTTLYTLAGGTANTPPNPSAMRSVVKQIGLKDQTIASEVGFALSGDIQTARAIATGRDRIKNNPDKYGPLDGAMRRDINSELDNLKLGAMFLVDRDDVMKKQIVEATRNVAVSLTNETNTTGKTDTTVIQDALKKVMGNVVEHNGRNTLAWANGEDSAGHTRLWRSLTPELLATAGNGLPYDGVGLTGTTEIPFNRVLKSGVLVPSADNDGTYNLALPASSSWYGGNSADMILAKNKNGGAYKVNIAKVLPELKDNRVKLYPSKYDNSYSGE